MQLSHFGRFSGKHKNGQNATNAFISRVWPNIFVEHLQKKHKMCIYIYNIYTYVHIDIYIYIAIHKQRSETKKINMYIYIYTRYLAPKNAKQCKYMYIYIYLYIDRYIDIIWLLFGKGNIYVYLYLLIFPPLSGMEKERYMYIYIYTYIVSLFFLGRETCVYI